MRAGRWWWRSVRGQGERPARRSDCVRAGACARRGAGWAGDGSDVGAALPRRGGGGAAGGPHRDPPRAQGSVRPGQQDRPERRTRLGRAGARRVVSGRLGPGAPAHAIRSLLLGRRMLLATRRTLENMLRGAVKRFGLIITRTAGLATDRTHRAEEGAGCGCAEAGRHHARHLVGRHRVRVEGCRLAPFRSPAPCGEVSLLGREPVSTSQR